MHACRLGTNAKTDHIKAFNTGKNIGSVYVRTNKIATYNNNYGQGRLNT